MRLIPKVTYDLKEYNLLANDNDTGSDPGFYIHGLYYNGVIWSRHPSFLTIFHELIHHFNVSIGDIDGGSFKLFMDFLDSLYDCMWSLTRFRGNREKVWHFVYYVRTTWNDFLDFYLCRDVGV